MKSKLALLNVFKMMLCMIKVNVIYKRNKNVKKNKNNKFIHLRCNVPQMTILALSQWIKESPWLHYCVSLIELPHVKWPFNRDWIFAINMMRLSAYQFSWKVRLRGNVVLFIDYFRIYYYFEIAFKFYLVFSFKLNNTSLI